MTRACVGWLGEPPDPPPPPDPPDPPEPPPDPPPPPPPVGVGQPRAGSCGVGQVAVGVAGEADARAVAHVAAGRARSPASNAPSRAEVLLPRMCWRSG